MSIWEWCWWTLLENNLELCLHFLNSPHVYVWERNKKIQLDFFFNMLETCWLAENQKTKYEISLFSCFTSQNQLFLSPLQLNSPSRCKIISRMASKSRVSFLLSFASGIKIWVIHHLESYWNKIANILSTLWRKSHCLSVFLYFTGEDLSISCWLLDWLHWDSLKILKKSTVWYKSNTGFYQSWAWGIIWGFYPETCH